MYATDDFVGLRRALSRHDDGVATGEPLVWILDRDMAEEDGYDDDERFQVMYKPARSDVSTAVPNGRFGDIVDAVDYPRSTVY